MESNEEYLLRALRRTSNGLTDSLIPAHGVKLTKLLNRFEATESVTHEVNSLLQVQGFGKCALAMEWLLERTKMSADYIAPEQFESDVLLLNEKLFEAFLNQPFDMPDYARSFEAPVRPIQQDIQFSDDEFLGTSVRSQETSVFDQPQQFAEEPIAEQGQRLQAMPEYSEPEPVIEEPVHEQPWSSSPDIQAFESALTSAPQQGPAESAALDSSPSLKDAMTPDLFESSERVAQTAVEFFDKTPSERPISMAVFRVTVRAAGETAKVAENIIVQDFCDTLLKLIAYADEQGKIKNDAFADIVRDTGDRLFVALKAEQGGVTLLKNLTAYLNNPKDLFSKR